MPLKLENLSVLVVEDIGPMRALIKAALESMKIGHVYTASNGNTGFDVYVKRDPDIIITDWDMEPVSGIEMTERIRRSGRSPSPQVPVIMISGFDMESRIRRARDAGITEYLVKPVTAAGLVNRITHVINNPRDFINTGDFIGPDRRRRDEGKYNGPDRRARDPKEN